VSILPKKGVQMLRIHFSYAGDNLLPNSSVLFKQYMMNRNDLLEHDFSKRVIQEIDHSTVINCSEIRSPERGIITRGDLSGGTKGLLLMEFEPVLYPFYFRGENFGDNCAKFILEISESKDIRLALWHFMDFSYGNANDFDVFIENSGTVAHGWREYFFAYCDYCTT
jgi:hypothetical protein